MGISQSDDMEMNLVAPNVEPTHGMIEKDNQKLEGGGNDPQPNRYKSYKDVVSKDNLIIQKKYCLITKRMIGLMRMILWESKIHKIWISMKIL